MLITKEQYKLIKQKCDELLSLLPEQDNVTIAGFVKLFVSDDLDFRGLSLIYCPIEKDKNKSEKFGLSALGTCLRFFKSVVPLVNNGILKDEDLNKLKEWL